MVNGATLTEEQQALEVAARAISDALNQEGLPSQIRLSNGVVLRLRKIPREVIKHVAEKYPEPEIPKVYIKDDDRWEENPNDPDYLKALDQRANVLQKAYGDICLGLGTELISVPDGVCRPEADGWLEDLDLMGIKVPREPPKARYMAWLRYYALESDEDVGLAEGLPLVMSTIGQEEVLRAMRTFRGRAGGETDPGVSAGEGDPDRPDVPKPDARPRARNRRARGV